MLATQRMGVFPVHLWKEGMRAGRGLFFLLFLSSMIACGVWTPQEKSREDRLRDDLRSFHWALMGQDVPIAVRYVPADERDAWEDAFTCIFQRLRLLDYRVSLMKFRNESNEATVRVRWTSHPPDSLVAKELQWNEEWSFDRTKQRWSLQPGPDALKGQPEDCLPEIPEREAPDEGASSD